MDERIIQVYSKERLAQSVTDENFNSHLILTRCSVFKDQTIHDDIQFGITPCSISSYFVANFISAATFLIYHTLHSLVNTFFKSYLLNNLVQPDLVKKRLIMYHTKQSGVNC
ncbi:hypothetical protein DJ90_6456 [Paenibacillus macerans]|uniref:Uncharacterized protein n=1 Tax=Paenibacillus macerans TaxID=44252 RepID=A0A090YPU8_PAEMA|nr:hypothetical protein DJ90_6456 [Paenibacillus macerans]